MKLTGGLDSGSERGFKWFISGEDSQSPDEATQRSKVMKQPLTSFRITVAPSQNLMSSLPSQHL